MSPEAVYTLVTGVVAVPKPYLITLISYYLLNKIKDDEPRKAAILLTNLFVGAIIAQLVNLMGGFGLTMLDCLIIGTPSAFAGGQSGHRFLKYMKNGKKNDKEGSGTK